MAFLSAAAGPAALNAVSVDAANAATTPSEPTFDINAIDVDGNTLLDETALETAVYPHMGPSRTRADVAQAQRALEEVYHARGYQSVVVEVPRQTVADGVVKLHVIEAPVGRLRVVGSRYHSLAEVEAAIPAIAEGKVVNFTAAQAQVTEANRLPERQITPVVRAGEVPGTVDVDLKVADQEPLHASLELNNEKSPFTKPLRLTANVRYDDLWQLGHSISATYEVAPQRRSDTEVYAGSYVAPVWNTPFSLLVFGFRSKSNVAAIGGVDVLSPGFDVGARAIYQFQSLGPISQSLSFGLDYKQFKETDNVTAEGLGALGVVNKAVSYLPLTATYTFRRQTEASTTVSAAVTANPRGLGNGDFGFQTKRANARANFIRANLDAEHLQPLADGFQLDARVSGQITDTALVTSEEFALGGFSSVRGYDEAETVGDNGVFGSLELRTPALLRRLGGKVDDFRAFVFVDGGDTWVLLPQAEQKSEFPLYSTGLGARFRLFDHLGGDVFTAFPLKAGPIRPDKRAYTTFSLKAEF